MLANLNVEQNRVFHISKLLSALIWLRDRLKPLLVGHHKSVLVLLLDYASVDHVADETGCLAVDTRLVLSRYQLLLDHVQAGHLGPVFILFGQLCCLVGLNLSLGSSALGACFKHVDS